MSRDRDLDAIIAAQPYPPGKNGRWRIDPRLAISVIGWIVTIALAWGGFNARLAVAEAQLQETDRRMQRLEDKVDQLLRRP